MKYAVVGSRTWIEESRIYTELDGRPYPSNIDEIHTGDSSGVDEFARKYAGLANLDLHIYCAGNPDNMRRLYPYATVIPVSNWAVEGRGAGIIRNTAIVENCNRLYAFWDGTSRGTLDSMKKAVKARKPTTVVF